MVSKARAARSATRVVDAVPKLAAELRARQSAAFVEPMACLGVTELQEGASWTYEIKLAGFRLEAVKTKGRVTLYSRRGNVLTQNLRSLSPQIPNESTTLRRPPCAVTVQTGIQFVPRAAARCRHDSHESNRRSRPHRPGRKLEPR